MRIIATKYPQGLIDDFGKKDLPEPQIAISVDMLDTGIDVPEVVNLVFATLAGRSRCSSTHTGFARKLLPSAQRRGNPPTTKAVSADKPILPTPTSAALCSLQRPAEKAGSSAPSKGNKQVRNSRFIIRASRSQYPHPVCVFYFLFSNISLLT